MRLKKNTWADYLLCLPAIALFASRAFHGIVAEVFITGTRGYPSRIYYGTTAVWLSIVDLFVVSLLVGWLLRGNRWRNLVWTILAVLFLGAAAGILIYKS